MNEYKSLINTLIQGGAMGIVGFAIGVMFISMSVKEALKYAIIAIISGSFSLHLAGVSPLENYKFHIAILAGLLGFFLIKITLLTLDKFSKAPIKTFIQILQSWKSKK